MNVAVTGASGFVGANLVRALLADGHRVRTLVSPTSSLKVLTGCPVEVVYGDAWIRTPLRTRSGACPLVFHVAADYRLWAPDHTALYRSNVEGTRTVLEACGRAGVERVVYTSSVGTLGILKDGGPGMETTPVRLEDMVGPYKRSKFLAERVARNTRRAGSRS